MLLLIKLCLCLYLSHFLIPRLLPHSVSIFPEYYTRYKVEGFLRNSIQFSVDNIVSMYGYVILHIKVDASRWVKQ